MPIPRLSSFIVHRSSLLLLLALPACSATPTLPAMKFDTITATIKDKHFTLEVADTDAKRERPHVPNLHARRPRHDLHLRHRR